MKTAPLAIPFREVRHFQPDDCLHVEAIAVRGKLHAWTIPAHRHEGLHQFQWLRRGRAELTLDGEALTVKAPCALLLAPGSVHGFVYAPDSQGLQVSVPSNLLLQGLRATPTLAERLRESAVIEGPFTAADRRELDRLFEGVTTEFERDAAGRSEALQAAALLLALWFLRHPALARSRHGAGLRDTLVQRYRALVQAHFREHQPLSFYAEALKVTPDHLSRACRGVAGQSALELLHERLLVEARRLLAFTELPVAEVAQTLGFDDAQYFSRFFARRSGLAPSAYRLRAAEGRSVKPTPEET